MSPIKPMYALCTLHCMDNEQGESACHMELTDTFRFRFNINGHVFSLDRDQLKNAIRALELGSYPQ